MEHGLRHEYKYLISRADAELLKLRLPHFMERDPHAGETGRYTIRSLYFDDFNNTAYYDKTDGVNYRAKYRIRFYNYDPSQLKLEKKDGWPFVALQIPTTDYTVNLGTSRLVNYAHKHDIAVQYWTINDPEEMAYLQSIGADAIMTDVPDQGAEMLTQP